MLASMRCEEYHNTLFTFKAIIRWSKTENTRREIGQEGYKMQKTCYLIYEAPILWQAITL